MKYFRERNKLNVDYSGHGEVSSPLRKRLSAICLKYISNSYETHNYWIPFDKLQHELSINLTKENIEDIISSDSYDYVFEAIEIYLALAKKYAQFNFDNKIFPDIQKAFDLSGSVYYVDKDNLINLRIENKLAQNLKETENILSESEKSYKIFFEAVGNLMTRKAKAKDIVKDLFVAFENYLKEKANENDFGKAIESFQKQELITNIQKVLLDKIYGYRSDAFAVGHAGNSREPDEIDALWFLETVIAQLKLIDKRLKQKK